MRATIIFLIILVVFAGITFILYEYSKSSLTWIVVFDVPDKSAEISSEGLRVFIIRESIGPPLDSLYARYEANVAAFEDSVTTLRQDAHMKADRVREEEALLRTVFGDAPRTDRRYLQNRRVVDRLIAERDSLNREYNVKRKRLIELQSEYNSIIAQLIDAKVLLKTEADEQGRFEFPRVPRDNYYVYAMRVLAGDKDITNEPPGVYYMYALTAQRIRKFSWMLKVYIERNSFIRLDSSNMTDVFK